MKRIVLILIFIVVVIDSQSQGKVNTDSLVQLSGSGADSVKIEANVKLATFYSNNNFELATKFAEKALNLSVKANYKKGEADSYHVMGLIQYYKGLRVFALENFLKAHKIRNSIGDKKGIASSSNMIGLIYKDQGDNEKALENYYNCLKLRKEINDRKGVSACYNNIGLVFRDMGDEDKGLEYFFKALDISRTINNTTSIGLLYNNIGYSYFLKGDYELAEDYYLQSLKMRENSEDVQGVTSVMTDLGLLYLSTNEPEKALEYLEKSYLIARKINVIHEIQRAAEVLNKAYLKVEDYKNAYVFYKEYVRLSDSINNKQLTEKLTQIELEVKFEKERQLEQVKQEKKDLEDKRELDQARFMRNILIVGSLALLIIAFILYRNFKRKKRDNNLLRQQKEEIFQKNEILQQQKDEIESQRDEIETQRDFVVQQRDEILRSKKEITDSIEYAKKIQQAIFTGKDEFKKILGDSFVFYQPRNIVSGDFYFISKKSDRIIVAVADCTGHGVPGAFMSMLGLTFFHDVVNEKGIVRPNVILNSIRDLIVAALKQNTGSDNISEIKDGMDVAVVSINMKSRIIEYAGANNPLYIVRRDSSFIEEIPADKMPLGYHQNMHNTFTNKSFSVAEGDKIYLFTDGFADQFGGKSNKKFKYKMFKQLLIWSSPRNTDDQEAVIENAFNEWKGDNEQVDDVLVVGVKF